MDSDFKVQNSQSWALYTWKSIFKKSI